MNGHMDDWVQCKGRNGSDLKVTGGKYYNKNVAGTRSQFGIEENRL